MIAAWIFGDLQVLCQTASILVPCSHCHFKVLQNWHHDSVLELHTPFPHVPQDKGVVFTTSVASDLATLVLDEPRLPLH